MRIWVNSKPCRVNGLVKVQEQIRMPRLDLFLIALNVL
nr:MAG TPA: Coenzyme F420 hydrogenase/dehydrogenase, beta subunit [Caudoviricetes sp.]